MYAKIKNAFFSRFGKGEGSDPTFTEDDIRALIVDESKLVRAKRKFIQEERFMKHGRSERSTDRLPPGQTLTDGFPVLDLGSKPEVPVDKWELRLDGEVENPQMISWQQLNDLPQATMTSDIHCVTAWSRFDNRWDGVLISTLLELCRPLPSAKAVMIHGYDGYHTNIQLADLCNPNAMIATSWQGEPLTLEHGGPARFVLPHLYFWKSAKWVKRIKFMREERRGYWEASGYHVRGDPWLQQRYRGDELIE
jgi:DMSO/TMAO reductase YedYZ molybdopterin-dependent catalytic subunit